MRVRNSDPHTLPNLLFAKVITWYYKQVNELRGTTFLKNRYFVLRHGESEANIAGLITSDPVQCISNYGLTKHGNEQVIATVRKAKLKGWLNAETVIYCSDFKRTVETAEVVRKMLGAGKFHVSRALRERSFGEYNGKKVSEYIEIWPQAKHDKLKQQKNGVEGPMEILDRLLTLIKQLESEYEGRNILLVSHGDPLQVLQAAFAGLSPEQSRLLKYIEPAEIRELTLKSRISY